MHINSQYDKENLNFMPYFDKNGSLVFYTELVACTPPMLTFHAQPKSVNETTQWQSKMEDSSSEEILSSDDGIVQKRCYMCIFPGNKAILKACTDKTWYRFIEFVPQWMNYDGNQSQIANNYARERVVVQNSADMTTEMYLVQ